MTEQHWERQREERKTEKKDSSKKEGWQTRTPVHILDVTAAPVLQVDYVNVCMRNTRAMQAGTPLWWRAEVRRRSSDVTSGTAAIPHARRASLSSTASNPSISRYSGFAVYLACIFGHFAERVNRYYTKGGPLRTPEGEFLWSCCNYIN